jgi:hypothetical protein
MSNKTSLELKKRPVARDTGIDTKTDEISKGLRKRIDDANRAADTAEEKVKVAYDYAIQVDKLRPREAAKVLYDRLKYSPTWIRKYLPDEAKMMSKARFVQPKRKSVSTTTTSDTVKVPPPRIEVQEAIIVDEKKEPVGTRMTTLGIIIPQERVKKFYTDILKIRDKAEKEGLRINQDCSVSINHSA